jgi:hypothetical protein
MLFRLVYYFIVIYLIYKGILFIVRLFTAVNKKNSNDPISPKSKFKDVEEAHYTEIKDVKDKDSH